jgi:hypothetical protein
MPGTAPIDAHSDVFALGEILYELLSGTLPCELSRAKARTYAELQRVSCGFDAVGHAEALAGETGWIAMKAIRPVREERYASAAELRADIAANLGGRLLVAAPEAIAYRLQKRVMRHRGRVPAAAFHGDGAFAGRIDGLLELRQRLAGAGAPAPSRCPSSSFSSRVRRSRSRSARTERRPRTRAPRSSAM